MTLFHSEGDNIVIDEILSPTKVVARILPNHSTYSNGRAAGKLTKRKIARAIKMLEPRKKTNMFGIKKLFNELESKFNQLHNEVMIFRPSRMLFSPDQKLTPKEYIDERINDLENKYKSEIGQLKKQIQKNEIAISLLAEAAGFEFEPCHHEPAKFVKAKKK